MASRTKRTNIENSIDRELLRQKLPIAFDSFYNTLHRCAGLLIDTSLPTALSKSCYALLSVEHTVFAYVFFLIAVCPRYRIAVACVTEEEDHIVLNIKMELRAGAVPCDPLVADETAYALFHSHATRTDLALATVPTADGFDARLSFVRFRADKFAAACVDEETVSTLMMEAMKEYAVRCHEKKV